MSSVTYKVHGLPQTMRALEAFKPSRQRTILRAGVRAYAGVMRKAVKVRAKRFKRTGALARAMGVVVRTRKDGSVHGRAGALRGKRFVLHTDDKGRSGIGRAAAKRSQKPGAKRIQPSRYSHLAEKKHNFHKQTENAKRSEGLAAFERKLREQIDKEARKQLAKATRR